MFILCCMSRLVVLVLCAACVLRCTVLLCAYVSIFSFTFFFFLFCQQLF